MRWGYLLILKKWPRQHDLGQNKNSIMGYTRNYCSGFGLFSNAGCFAVLTEAVIAYDCPALSIAEI